MKRNMILVAVATVVLACLIVFSRGHRAGRPTSAPTKKDLDALINQTIRNTYGPDEKEADAGYRAFLEFESQASQLH